MLATSFIIVCINLVLMCQQLILLLNLEHSRVIFIEREGITCINHNLSKAVWKAGCNAALIAKDKSCSLSGYLSSQACR